MNGHISIFLFLIVCIFSAGKGKCKCGENVSPSDDFNSTCSLEGDSPKFIASGREKALTQYPHERTLIMIKPDGVVRGLIGKCIQKFEKKMFKLLAMKFVSPSLSTIEKHYAEHADAPYISQLIAHMQSAPVVVMVWEGPDVIAQARKIIGTTSPNEAPVGTIRGDYGADIIKNIIHASSNVESAISEIKVWFSDDELVSWKNSQYPWDFPQPHNA